MKAIDKMARKIMDLLPLETDLAVEGNKLFLESISSSKATAYETKGMALQGSLRIQIGAARKGKAPFKIKAIDIKASDGKTAFKQKVRSFMTGVFDFSSGKGFVTGNLDAYAGIRAKPQKLNIGSDVFVDLLAGTISLKAGYFQLKLSGQRTARPAMVYGEMVFPCLFSKKTPTCKAIFIRRMGGLQATCNIDRCANRTRCTLQKARRGQNPPQWRDVPDGTEARDRRYRYQCICR